MCGIACVVWQASCTLVYILDIMWPGGLVRPAQWHKQSI